MSWPSTTMPGIPYGSARRARSEPPLVVVLSGEYSPYRLFVMMNTTGAFQTEAMFSASWNVPMFVAPSPKKLEARRSGVSWHLEPDRRTDRDRQAGADDGIGADVAFREVDQVHRAADAARAAGRLAHQLGKRGLGVIPSASASP